MPPCVNCNQPYSEHAWRSGKGACLKPPVGQKTFYRAAGAPADPRQKGRTA